MSRPQQPEGVIKTQVKEALQRMGIFVCSNTLGGRTYSTGLGPGSSDLVCCIRGRWVSMEIKTQTGVPAANQLAWAENLRESGGFYFVVRSVQDALEAVETVRKVAA